MILEKTTKYVANSEDIARSLIEDARNEANTKGYTVKKAGYERKVKKSKGEIIGERWVVSITNVYGEIWEDLE